MTHAQTPHVAGSTADNQQKRRRQASFKAQLKEQPWRSHQPVSMPVKQGKYCMYEYCRGHTGGQQQVKRQRRGYRTKYRCEECSIMTGEDVWLCNNTKTTGGTYKSHHCHIKYHKKNHHLICPAALSTTAEEASTTTVTPESSPAAAASIRDI